MRGSHSKPFQPFHALHKFHTSLLQVLCDLANAIKPGIVPRVTRAPKAAGGGGGMSAMRLAAKQRDNITRYLEACSFLGVRRRQSDGLLT